MAAQLIDGLGGERRARNDARNGIKYGVKSAAKNVFLIDIVSLVISGLQWPFADIVI